MNNISIETNYLLIFYIVTSTGFFLINLYDMYRYTKTMNKNIMSLETANEIMNEVESLANDNKLLIKDATNLLNCANNINSKISALYKTNPQNEHIAKLHEVMAYEVDQYRKRQQM